MADQYQNQHHTQSHKCIKPYNLEIRPFQNCDDYKWISAQNVWAESYPEHSWTSKVELFAKLLNSWKLRIHKIFDITPVDLKIFFLRIKNICIWKGQQISFLIIVPIKNKNIKFWKKIIEQFYCSWSKKVRLEDVAF